MSMTGYSSVINLQRKRGLGGIAGGACNYYMIISPCLHPDTPDSANVHETSPASSESPAVMPGNYTDKV